LELWLVVEGPGGKQNDVAVDVEPGHTMASLADALAARLGLATPTDRRVYSIRQGMAFDPEQTVLASGLRFGDRLSLGISPGVSAHRRSGNAVATVSIIGGPATGMQFVLAPGDHVLGRSSQVDLAVDDPTLSRNHVRFTVRESGVAISDMGSSNGTFIDGTAIAGSIDLAYGTVVEAGHTLMRVDAHKPGASPSTSGDGGVVRFNRPPRVTPPPPERIFKLPAPPERPQKGRIPMVSALAPLALGAPLLVIGLNQHNGSTLVVMGLVSMIGSPLMALAAYSEDRRSGKGAFRKKQVEFYDQLADTSAKMSASLADEVIDRRRRSPDAGDLADRCANLRSNLWERRPDDADFLQVAGGWCDQPSSAQVEIGDGGDPQLRGEAETELAKLSTARNVPVVVDITRAGVVGLCGDDAAVQGLARWIVVQLATLHSPRDLTIAVALATEDRAGWEWAPWLPHLRSDTSPIEGHHMVVGDADAAELFESIDGLVRARRAESGNRLAESRKPQPAVMLFVSEKLKVPRTAVTRILEDGPGVGVYVAWMGSRADHLPGECGEVAETTATPPSFNLLLPNSGQRIDAAVLDLLSVEAARDVALALAPVKDVTAGGVRGQIPRNVSLLELLELGTPTAEAIAQRWRTSGFGVDAPVGVSAGGKFVLDMRHDGPHALVGGTTGAGKSELLQTFVAALAANHPPTRVTFLLVDYKGGAAFKDAVHLPHTVGFVTDLDGHLVNRALVSLNAELRRREHLLRDHGAKDLLEMERRVPDSAPPSLLLIVDEFASLAKELPEFVDGVVNVAQRGRSLGIHLILATQRPAGSINDNVRANTNLRIALRMNDAADSEDVINTKDAALLPRTLPGRAFARTGQAELTEVQVAYVGGHTAANDESSGRSVEVMDLQLGEVTRHAAKRLNDDASTDLQLIVQAVTRAATAEGIPQQHPPWLAPLAALLPLANLPAAGDGRALVGVVDLPAEQAQQPWFWDLEDEGSVFVFGTSGSGKTTLLRTLAVSLAKHHSPDEINIYGLDFATRGLTSLSALPHVGSVVSGDDTERVQRLIVMLEREIARRKDLFATVGASLLSEYLRAVPDAAVPRVVVLFDGYSGFSSTFEKIDFGDWIERIPRLVGEGRPLGIHWVITADRRNAIGITLGTTVSTKIVFRMADDDDYATLGLDGRTAKAAALVPGRGFVGNTIEMHAAMVGDDPAGDAQVAAVERIGAALRVLYPAARVATVGSLPLVVPRSEMPVGDNLCAVVGLGQSHLSPVSIDLSDGNLLVAGPNRSGRSTTLATIAWSLRGSTPTARLFVLAPRRSPLLELDVWERSARGASECDELATDLADMIDDREMDDPPIIVFVDDGNELADTTADGALERIIRRGRDVAMSVVGAAESTSALRCYSGWIPEIRKDRRAILLNPDPDIDGDLVGVRLPRRAGGGLPPGRGYVVLDGGVELVQVTI
jgi:S-DNA-T family DNA segregation ATPase FtsK/SpoIIIE